MRRMQALPFLRSTTMALLIALGLLSGISRPSTAATTRRYNVDDTGGNFTIFGNTVGFDCRDNRVEKPVVGSVPVGLLGLFSCNGILADADTGVDIFWRSETPNANQATANQAFDQGQARSTAILALPAGAQILMARLYWAAQRNGGNGAGTAVTFERPGTFSKLVMAETSASKVLSISGLDYYQSSADVTRDVQKYLSGAYRVGNIQTIDVRTRNEDVAFVAWNVVVFYHLDGDNTTRNLSLYDGLERVSTSAGSNTNVTLNGFTTQAGFNAKLGVIAYEGDNEITGDQLKVNGTAISNMFNPADNFFNRSSTNLGALAPRAGDLPQMSGRPSSMSGYDADIIDITAQVPANSTSLQLSATTSGDEYFLGVFATAVGTVRPVFTQTSKTVTNLSRSDGRFLPGDTLEYIISTKNTGNDTATQVKVTDVLPAGLTFVSGSINYLTGVNLGTKTDAAGDDQADYNSANRTITANLGTGANATTGGNMAMNDTASFRFRVTIAASAMGTINNQAFLSAVGQTAAAQGSPTITWPSGNGVSPNVETPVIISTCSTNADCPSSAPICDTSATPRVCICNNNSDCPTGLYCAPTSKQCVQCIPGMVGMCDANTTGGICLANSTCGCNTNVDCNGRTCDMATKTCAAVNTDLTVTLTRTPTGSMVPPGTMLTYTLTAANNGSVAINGATLNASISPNLAGAMWTCMAQGSAVCPMPTGAPPSQALISLPPGSKLIYTATVTAPTDPATSSLDFTGAITPPRGFTDTKPEDNLVTDSVIIGVPTTGPDLSITVREEPSKEDSSVTYTVEVTNHGPGTAPGATVVYEVPANTEVVVTAGEGWSCERPSNGTQVICTRTQPIPEGMASPIMIKVTGQPGTTELPLKVSVAATDGSGQPLADPNGSDNTIDRSTMLYQFRLSGGGFSACSVGAGVGSSSTSQSGPLAAAAMGLVALALGLRSAQRRRQALPRRIG